MDIKLTTKQAEYVREAHHRWNFAIGAVRSGKSHLAVQFTVPDRLLAGRGRKGLNLILGATKENIERNVLSPMRDIWGERVVGDINTRNWCDVMGEKVYCIGAENVRQVSKLRGSEIKFCYCDEICDINSEVFEMLKSRLSLPYSECHAAANPASPTHFVKRFIDTPGVDLFCQHYTIYDNPFLPESYVRGLEAEYAGTVYYDRYILGLWAKAEGLVYPMYREALEPTWRPAVSISRPRTVVSVDYGTQNAFAALKWRRDAEGVWHAIDEYRYSGREEGHQKTDEDYVADLVEFCRDSFVESEEDGIVPGAEVQVIVDPSATSFIAALRRTRLFRIRRADNDVARGIQDTAVCLQRGTVRISEDTCPWTVREFAGYVWDDCDWADRPIKVDDHCMDALRYFVRTMRLCRGLDHGYESVVDKLGQEDMGPRRFIL